MGIHEDAREGTLVGKTLSKYILGDPDVINEQDPVEGMTPLAAATVEGHVEVVKQLLRKGAKRDALCRNGETPLLLAAQKAKQNRSRAIQLLLEKAPGGYVDTTCDLVKNDTPLMLVLKNTQPVDLESVRLLRKAGASRTLANDDGETADEIAEKTGDKKVANALDLEKQLNAKDKLIEMVLTLLLYIIAWVNKALDGAVYKKHGLKGRLDPSLDMQVETSDETSGTEFKDKVHNFVQDKPALKKFFNGREFIQDVAEKAVELEKDSTTSLGSPDLLSKTIEVTLHQQVMLCDDSGSMKHEGRFDSLKKLVERITRITTRVLPDGEGVALRFINQDVDDASNLTLSQIRSILGPMKQKAGGDTETGTTLRAKILQPLVYSKLEQGGLKRPLLISILTDGQPSGERKTEFLDAIIECGKRLHEAGYPRESVRFLVGQIGTAKSATKFLDTIRENKDIADVLYCTTDQLDAKYSDFHDNESNLDRWLIETLFLPMKNYDSESQ